MNRRGFLTALSALATTAVLPAVPSIPLPVGIDIHKIMLSSIYGKFGGGRVVYFDTDSVVCVYNDVHSSYPYSMLRNRT